MPRASTPFAFPKRRCAHLSCLHLQGFAPCAVCARGVLCSPLPLFCSPFRSPELCSAFSRRTCRSARRTQQLTMDEYQSMDSLGSPTRESEQELKLFVPFVTLAQVLGLASVVVTAVWMGHYWKGFQWSSDEVFNYHPLFMVIGLIFLYADSILAYRVFRNSNKRPVKFLHAGLHIGALVFSIVGLFAVFDFHNKKGIPNMYSFHSWLGITVVGLYVLQWLVGFLIYLLPCAGNDLRAALMPFHRGIGVGVFVLAIATALLGITEKNIFSQNYAKLLVRERFGNALSILLVLFGAVVVYIVTKFEYRRVDLVTSERIRLSN